MASPSPGQPETNREVNLPAEEGDPTDRGRVWIHSRTRYPTRVWFKVIWDRIELHIGFVTTGHPIHNALTYNMLVVAGVIATAASAWVCFLMDAPIWLSIPLSLLTGISTTKLGMSHLARRRPSIRRHRHRR